MSYTVLESTWLRSLVKGLIWEASGLVTVAVIAFLFTGDPKRALLIGAAYLPVRVAMYLVHERVWKRVGWGHREVIHHD